MGSDGDSSYSSSSTTTNSASEKGEGTKRVERRLDIANSRVDMLASRLDELELIRKERIEWRRRQNEEMLE